MPYYMYVSLQDDDKIAIFTMDAGTGQLTPQGEVPVSGGPSPLTLSPDRQVLYVGHRTVPGISGSSPLNRLSLPKSFQSVSNQNAFH